MTPNPLCGWKGWQARLLQAQLSAILFAFVSARAYFYHGFASVFAHRNIMHAHRYSNLCSFAWRKVCPQRSAQCACRR